jgi:hypothetical protein
VQTAGLFLCLVQTNLSEKDLSKFIDCRFPLPEIETIIEKDIASTFLYFISEYVFCNNIPYSILEIKP